MAELTLSSEKPANTPWDVDLRTLTELLIHHHGLKDGWFDLSFTIRIGVGGIGPTPESILPGASFGIEAIGLRKVDKMSSVTVDAATLAKVQERPAAKAAKTAPKAKNVGK